MTCKFLHLLPECNIVVIVDRPEFSKASHFSS
jgi:hypothetical protein